MAVVSRALIEAMLKLTPRPPEIWVSAWMPRGKAFEMNIPNLLAPPTKILPDGGLVRETRRVLTVNADDFADAVRALDAEGK